MESQTIPSNSLEAVIRSVDDNAQGNQTTEKRVVIDIAGRTAVLSTWFRSVSNFKFFLVDASQTAKGQTQVIYISDLENGRALALKIDYEVSCVPGEEDRLAEALFDGSSPTAVFHGIIKQWVHGYIAQQPAAFIKDFFRIRESLELQLADYVRAETGLMTRAAIFACGELELEDSIVIGPLSVPVNLKDHAVPRSLRFTAELLLDEENKINALTYHPDSLKLEELLTEQVCQYFTEQVTSQQFYAQLNTGDFKSQIKTYLDETLRTFGRRINTIELEHVSRLPPEFYDTQKDITYSAYDDPTPVTIRYIVKMCCQSYAHYLDSNSPELEVWLTQNLENVIYKTLFRKKYIDILLDFDTLAKEIINELSFKAAAIGFELQQDVKLLGCEPSTLLEAFRIKRQQTFETILDGVYVSLEISVAARLQQLQHVKEHLRRHLSVPQVIEERLVQQVGQTLRQIHPESFYLHFRSVKATSSPVEKLLEDQIRDVLVREFDAEVSAVELRTMDTEFTGWLRKLLGEHFEFDVEFASLSAAEQGTISIRGDCIIKAIHQKGWEKLQTMSLDLEMIKRQMINNLRSEMETRSNASLAYPNNESAEEVKKEIERLVREYVLDEFGLLVKIENLRRGMTSSEIDLKKRLEEIRRKNREAGMANELLRIEEIRKLDQHLIQLLASGGMESEITQIRARIAILRAHRTTELSSPVDEDRWPSQPVSGEPENLINSFEPKELAAAQSLSEEP